VTAAQLAKARLRRIPGAVRSVQLLRRAAFQATLAQRGRRIDSYMRTHTVRKLQLGTGSNILEGWLNTDIYDEKRTNEVVYLDARKPFPLPDASFDLVFTEHMLEHISYREALRCLTECCRVLKPGGRIRVATPSLENLIRLYEAQPTDLHRRYVRWSVDSFIEEADAHLPGFVVNNFLRDWGHRFVFDEGTLRHAFQVVGFVDVEEKSVGESSDPELVGLEHHGLMIPAEFNAFETLILEGRKP
jgi:predicted SAM-dependent methyltransferase